ncbi:uncharacterized protein B0P05DRAFT_547858 [Gilbertella persicaria]|uniref:NAD-dependent epimerase/dehydratase domain-containing protein n=1 Tax=Rhizopus stolonifer TaxID=4846 RepID=A0A367JUR8_RHIST|nr:uncharacterized protein B0P05DRAFT_547858 [Gilbertella persicaria]KAI8074249.1 hypothetical protein B0P05DRAFT_547858 [Gilbertella persicaria]RCH93683.1 hypothetical protein CU098_006612 [Rhizopus stolonifer]
MATSLLLVGGTGLVSSAIIRESKKYQHLPSYHNTHIYALSRNAAAKKSVEGITFIQGDALDPASLQVPFETNPNVVHTVGTLLDQSKKHGANGTYDRLNRDAAITVADTMLSKYDHIHRRCLVYFSAANAPPSFLLNERYILAKREAEQALLGPKYKDKIRVVVFRPGLIYSYHRRQLMLPFALGLIVGSAILKPLTSYIPQEALYITDRPLEDTEVSHAVFEALEDESVEGICDIDRIRQLAKEWERRKCK